jgi:hypothetical protein
LLTRIQALLVLGRDSEALHRLDADGNLPTELSALRGELRAAANRCADAIADFDRALSRARSGRVAERALYGRGTCRATLHDEARARADLRAYLVRFPSGDRALAVRRALGEQAE